MIPKKLVTAIMFVLVILMFTGCAWNRFNLTDTAQGLGEATIAATLANNPSQKEGVCNGLVNLVLLLEAPCCWKDYMLEIPKAFNQPGYQPYAVFITRMLKSDAPVLDYINMSDGDKANIKSVFSNISTDIGCKK
jgi:hypothetical protein